MELVDGEAGRWAAGCDGDAETGGSAAAARVRGMLGGGRLGGGGRDGRGEGVARRGWEQGYSGEGIVARGLSSEVARAGGLEACAAALVRARGSCAVAVREAGLVVAGWVVAGSVCREG